MKSMGCLIPKEDSWTLRRVSDGSLSFRRREQFMVETKDKQRDHVVNEKSDTNQCKSMNCKEVYGVHKSGVWCVNENGEGIGP